MALNTATFWHELGKLIELPKNCQSFTLTLKPRQPVMVECVCLPDGGPLDSEPVTKRYRLEEVEGEGTQVSTSQSDPA